MTESQEEALYSNLAGHYDEIYHWKDYEKEVRKITMLIDQYKKSSGSSLVDFACGTGKHLSLLRKNFDCVGVDISKDMLAIAKKNAPTEEFLKGYMVDYDLHRRFDVVLCLFSSIGHLKTRSQVRKAISNFARHLKKGGVLIVEPWIRKSGWREKIVDMQTFDTDTLKIVRMNSGRAEGAFSVIDERYLVGEAGKGVSYFKSRLKMRFFEQEYVMKTLVDARLNPIFTENGLMPGRGLLIAVRPP